MPKRLVAVGDLVLDILLESRLPVVADGHQMSPALLLEPGGACTTLLAARNLGMEAVALGAIGEDIQGRALLDMLSAADVDVSAVVRGTGATTTTVIALSDRRAPAHVFLGSYGHSPPINFTAGAKRQLKRADAVFIAGYSLVEPRLEPLISGALDFLAERETPLYIDVGPFLGQLNQAGVDRVLRSADTLILTDDEIRFVAAGESGLDACRRLLRACPRLKIALKRGADGCHLLAQGLDSAIPGFPADAVDTIGAGDAFAAAYIWAELNGYCPRVCGTIGNAMGAASVAKSGGGRNAPSKAETQAVLDENGTGIKLSC